MESSQEKLIKLASFVDMYTTIKETFREGETSVQHTAQKVTVIAKIDNKKYRAEAITKAQCCNIILDEYEFLKGYKNEE